MKSKISLFDKGVCKNLLKRFWPLWSAYFLLLIIMLPINALSSTLEGANRYYINQSILNSGISSIGVSFVAAGLVALAMFGFMYSSRSCGLMCSLPLRRETVFTTACLTGIFPLLLADVLVFALSALIFGGDEYIEMGYLAQWLGIAVMGNVSFFGIAVLCAMLTGSGLVMPVVYFVLNLAAYVAEGAIRALLSLFVYGFSYDTTLFTWLSPLVQLGSMGVSGEYELINGINYVIPGSFRVSNMGMLGGYCAAGIALLLIALLLFRRRSMETAGDVVAIPVLKPVFKYCMAVGGGIVFACAMSERVIKGAVTGSTAALIAAVMMLIGAFIGYYAAEMLMQKSMTVFRSGFKGFAAVGCAMLVVVALGEFDVFGYEKAVPEAEDVDYIQLGFINGQISEPENIAAFIEVHKQIIENKEQNENADASVYFPVNYYTKAGKHIGRIYSIDSGDEALRDPDSELCRWEDICNSEEVTRQRTSFKQPVTLDSIGMCNIDIHYTSADGDYIQDNMRLSPEQALQLYEQCIRPDIQDGELGRFWMIQRDDYYDVKSNVSVYMELVNRDLPDGENDKYEGMEFNIQMDSRRCLEWLRENSDFEPISLRQAERLGPMGQSGYADVAAEA